MRLQKPPWKTCVSDTHEQLLFVNVKLQAPFCETRTCSAQVFGLFGMNEKASSFGLMLALTLVRPAVFED
jgi:hypothetical protein